MVNHQGNVRPWEPTPEQESVLRATDATMEWLWDLPHQIRVRYAGQWVAAKDCQIVASASTMVEPCDKLDDPANPALISERLEKRVSIRTATPRGGSGEKASSTAFASSLTSRVCKPNSSCGRHNANAPTQVLTPTY